LQLPLLLKFAAVFLETRNMNKIKFLLAFTLFITAQHLIFAQSSLLKYEERSILINGTPVNVISITLKGELKDIKKSWTSFVKKETKKRMKDKKGVLILKETVIPQITDKRGDLVSYVYKKGNDVSLNVGYKLGYDVYLNSSQYPDEFGKLKDFVNYFACNYYDNYLTGYIKVRERELKDLMRKYNRAQKAIKNKENENRKLQKTIARNNKKIGKIDRKLTRTDNAVKKDMLNSDKAKLQGINADKEKTIKYNKSEIATQNTIISSLQPAIDRLNNEINSAKLTLIEIKSKIQPSK